MMRQSNNKHYDTPGGLLGHPTNVSSHPKPPVSKEDETMKQITKKTKIINYMLELGFTARETFLFIKKFGVNKAFEIVTSEGGE